MLRLAIGKFEGEPYHGVRLGEAWGGPLIRTTLGGHIVWAPGFREQGQAAASLLHALELVIAASARWIAVELLKDPAPPADGEKVVGVALWLEDRDGSHVLMAALDGKLRNGRVYTHAGGAIAIRPRLISAQGIDEDRVACASEEGAFAALIEHIAQWIAAALVKEVAAEENKAPRPVPRSLRGKVITWFNANRGRRVIPHDVQNSIGDEGDVAKVRTILEKLHRDGWLCRDPPGPECEYIYSAVKEIEP